MLKEKAVAALGQQSLLMPAWIKSALAANNRLKLYLTMLQSAAQHAAAPEAPPADWGRELAQAGLHGAGWLRDLVKSAYFNDDILVLPQIDQLVDALSDDLALMARPVCDGDPAGESALVARRDHWLQRLRALAQEEGIDRGRLAELTRGERDKGDSFHLLVMDLHKQINALAAEVATEDIDGAHVWQIEDEDRALVRAFMRGLHRTAGLKFSHPGLDTAVTRDCARLLIQNDIGTNDVHVLVIEVERRTVRLTYSDLHLGRFAFFREMLEVLGFEWEIVAPVTADGLNAGKPYQVGHAHLKARNVERLADALAALASRIVFVIDWNRARKRLQNFVSKAQAVDLLRQCAREEWGHMGWLIAGGERLVYEAMQAVDSEAFRVGDRLDDVLGANAARDYLVELMHMASLMLRNQQPVALIADEARMLLARVLRQRTFEFDLLAEHSAYCHALADALCDALERGVSLSEADGAALVTRCKVWERAADHLLIEARQRAERQPRWLPVVDLLTRADDVADALEEAAFILSMAHAAPMSGLPGEVRELLHRLAATTLAAIQDQVRAVEIARRVTERSDHADNEAFLETLWRMLRAERLCDDLTRQARRAIVRSLHDSAAGLLLANDLAATIEKASDALLTSGYALRQLVFAKTGMSA